MQGESAETRTAVAVAAERIAGALGPTDRGMPGPVTVMWVPNHLVTAVLALIVADGTETGANGVGA